MLDDDEVRPVVVRAGNARLEGDLILPSRPLGVVLIADVSGSTRTSPANLFVARALGQRQLASLALNLLSAGEAAADARTGWLRNDAVLLAARIVAARRWLATAPEVRDVPVGLFAVPAAACAALAAAGEEPGFGAIVICPGCRNPLAEAAPASVRAPTLLLSGMDESELRAADRVLAALECQRQLAVVPGLDSFAQPGALEAAASLAAVWFERHLAGQWLEQHPA